MLDEVKIVQEEISKIQEEIKNTPWWQKRIF